MTIRTHNYDITRNTTGGRETPKYIVLHYTATSGATANNELLYFATNPAATNASADFFVDDKEIVQYNTKLDSRYSWAVGDGTGGSFGGVCSNKNQISIEMSCNLIGSYWRISEKTYNNAVELTKYLMSKYSIPVSNVIRHYDVSKKYCPNVSGWIPPLGESIWQKFKQDITSGTATVKPAQANEQKVLYRVQCGAFSVKANAETFVKTLKTKGFKDAFIVTANSGMSDIRYRVQCGAFTDHANAETMKKKLQKAGVKDAFIIQNNAAAAKKTVDELAREVIAGKWGTGTDRKNRLTAAGYDYSAVQSIVNKLMS